MAMTMDIRERVLLASLEKYYTQAMDLVDGNLCIRCAQYTEECEYNMCDVAFKLLLVYENDLACVKARWN